MNKRGRRLSAEEEKLWKKVTDTATPMSPRPVVLKSTLQPETPDERAPFTRFHLGERAPRTSTETRIPATEHPLRMDKKAFMRMKRGKSNPDARIDLHGMTVDRAHGALRAFLMRCHAERKRLVLVITGKGKNGEDKGPIPQPGGILRRQVPHWLEQPPLNQIVLQTTSAHQRHGGSGALYVYLRR